MESAKSNISIKFCNDQDQNRNEQQLEDISYKKFSDRLKTLH